jgi:acetoin utilization deacetylase AcuC-like enzyme
MRLSEAAFGWMASALANVADASAQGRIALVLEGGYDLVALESCLASAVDGLLDGPAADLPRCPDHPDVARAAQAAHAAWDRVE